MKNKLFSKLISIVQVLAILVSAAFMLPTVPANAAGIKWQESGAEIIVHPNGRQVDQSLLERLSVDNGSAGDMGNQPDKDYEPTDVVRVAIVLEEKSTAKMGYSVLNITQNPTAMVHSDSLKQKQDTLAQKISAQILGGQPLDVVWNLTLTCNLIAANVPYGAVEEIAQMSGVSKVVVEQPRQPIKTVEENSANTLTFTSGSMTGSHQVWQTGYTGAGTRIAVIDTGTDTDHQSFDNGAYLYALQKNAEKEGLSYEDYLQSLDLLDKDEIARILPYLHISQRYRGVTAEDLFVSEKLAFGFNYVDNNFNLDHDDDGQGEHGSHVAGIATANRYIPKDGSYVSSLEEVAMAGVAPDAQLLTMKVFGANGGAYPSDYFAAIEDAVLLGCDSINLSLGGSEPGDGFDELYQDVMDSLENTDVVVSVASGNSGHWSANAYTGSDGYLYSDGVTFQTGGDPGTYQNSFTVASVDNQGVAGIYLKANGVYASFAESFEDPETGAEFGNRPIASLDTSTDGSGTTYKYVMVASGGTKEAFEGLDLTGKVVLCWRDGVNAFEDMALNAVEKGAIATVICNNEDELILIGLTNYGQYTDAPIVSIIQSEAQEILEASEAHTTEAGATYYTGQMLIKDGIQVALSSSDSYMMSWFSSWGVPGNLTLKPEISAPGGSIYSVYGSTPSGGGSDQYEVMSGTSMAAPQVAGMSALMMQYLEESRLGNRPGLTDRALAQSLLMSTAVPLRDETANNNYFSVLQQGAGMARIDLATTASSYVLVEGQDDGKVKAELGDDPDRAGVYSFTYSLNNLTDKESEYALSGDMFTQAVFYDEEVGEWFLSTATTPLNAAFTFKVGGREVTEVVLPGGGSVSVEVTMTLTAEAKAYLAVNHPTGAYLEAYVYAEERAAEEGVKHSIPVLGYYGSWTEPSMFEVGSYVDRQYGTDARNPYTGTVSNYLTLIMERGGTEYYWGGNPYVEEEEYLPYRNGFNNASGQVLEQLVFTLVRNAIDAGLVISNRDTGEVYYQETYGEVTGAYFSDYTYSWNNEVYSAILHWMGTDAEGNYLPEGTNVEISLVAAPEYYRNADGSVNWDQLDAGAYQNYYLTIDNTSPVLRNIELDPETGDFLRMTAYDNHYVAAVSLLNADGTRVLTSVAANQTEAGAPLELEMDLTEVYGKGNYLLAVYDYAMNQTIYEIELDLGIIEDRPHFTAFNFSKSNPDGSTDWTGITLDGQTRILGRTPADIGIPMQAEFVDGYVFVITDGFDLYVCDDSTLGDMTFIRNLDPRGELGIGFLWDMAYNYADGKLYFNYHGPSWERTTLSSIDLHTGVVTEEGMLPEDLINLAIDDEGNFYGVKWQLGGSAPLYRYRLEDLDTNNATLIGQTGKYVTGYNSLAWDHDNDKLYWSCGQNGLYELSTENAEMTMVYDNNDYLLGLFVRPAEYDSDRFAPTDEITDIEITGNALALMNNSSKLSASVYPWNASSRDVVWTSSNENVAVVDANGLVTAVSAGRTTITATSVVDTAVSASVTFTVTELEEEFYTFLQEDATVSWGKFSTSDPMDVATSFQLDLNIISAAWGPGGKLYAASLNENDDGWTTDLYTVNPITGDAALIGESGVYYTDMAYSPAFDVLLAVCENYLVIIDHTTGDFRGGWEWSETPLAGITHYYSGYNSTYWTEEDLFLIVDANGNVFIESLLVYDGSYEILNGPSDAYGRIQDITDDLTISSAHYDGSRWMYWTAFNEAENRTYLYAWDSHSDATYTLHVYDEGVSPMALLEVRDLYQKGDANRDGDVTADDATLIMEYIVELDDAEERIDLELADVDGDGAVTTNDANLIVLLCGGVISSFPG